MKKFFTYMFWFVIFINLAIINALLTLIGVFVYHPIISVGFISVGLFLIFAFVEYAGMEESFEKMIKELKNENRTRTD